MIRTEDIERLAEQYGEEKATESGLRFPSKVRAYAKEAERVLRWLDGHDYHLIPEWRIRKEWDSFIGHNRKGDTTSYDIGEPFAGLFATGIFENLNTQS